MIKEITLPDISENVTTGEVVNVLVFKDDSIEKDQTILELETEKALVEVPSPEAGKVVEVTVKEGDTLEVGQTILKLETEGDESEEPKKVAAKVAGDVGEEEEAGESGKQEQKEEEAEKEEKEEKKEKEEEEEEKGKKTGEKEKAEAEKKKESEEKEEQKDETKAAEEQEKTEASSKVEKEPQEEEHRGIPASPAAQRVARELSVDIADVKGSGPEGEISEVDVRKHAGASGNKEERPAAPVEKQLPDFEKWGKVRREAMSNVRRVTAENLAYAWPTIPHVTQFDKADITRLEEFRNEYTEKAEKAGGKLTITAILLKVVASALKTFPQFNASLDMEKKEIIYKEYYHIGVAVDTERGLIVPVIRDVDTKSIMQIAKELTAISEKARDRKTSIEDMQGGTFSVSNLGGIGGTYFTPVVYWPQVAILGVSRAKTEPVFDKGICEPRLMLPLSVSYDHRAIDGADGARFLRWIVEAIDNPVLMALEG